MDHGLGDDLGDEDASTGDLVWSRTLSRLQSKIMPKLRAESIEGDVLSSTNKKEKVDIHIEQDFQLAYFFRNVSSKHAVLLKEKELRFPASAPMVASEAPATMLPPVLPASAVRKSSTGSLMPASRLAERQSDNTDNVVGQGAMIANEEAEGTLAGRKRGRDQVEAEGWLHDYPTKIKEEHDEEDVPLLPAVEPDAIDVDQSEEDKKPRLHVNYSGFKIFGKCFIIVIEPTKRTRRLRPSLFETLTPAERPQLSATPVSRQSRETVRPSQSLSGRRSQSLAHTDVDDSEEPERGDSRRDRLSVGLFRGTPSQWTPTPEPETRAEQHIQQQQQQHASRAVQMEDDGGVDGDDNNSSSLMLATQMLEGGFAGQGNDIDDD